MNQEEIIKLFEDSKALLKGHFKLTSGRHSDVYYEKFTLLKQPVLCTRICQQMAELFKDYSELSDRLLEEEIQYSDVESVVKEYNQWKAE